MYAIIEDGGKQYKVQQGENVCLETRDLAEGETAIIFDKVLFIGDEENNTVGQPYVEGAKVTGTVKKDVTGPKLYPMTFKRRKDSQRRMGHRQKYIEVEITEITTA